jgi:hypothetical protein
MTSLKPSVVTIAARANRRVMSALVATVVPWEKSPTSAGETPTATIPSKTASMGSRVEETFPTRVPPPSSSKTQMSVNVPPISTARCSNVVSLTPLRHAATAYTNARPRARPGL